MKRGNGWSKYLLLVLVLYAMYTVGRLAYKNYQLNLQEAQLETDIVGLQNEIQDLRNKIVYYQSDSYKDKMVRAKFNLKKKGEEVVVITPSPEVEHVVEKEDLPDTNPERWLYYFFGRQA